MSEAAADWLARTVAESHITDESPLWPVLIAAAQDPTLPKQRHGLLSRRLRPQPWWPLASAMQLLVFADHFELAAELCERTVAQFAGRPDSTIVDETEPFSTVLLAPALPGLRLPDPAVDDDDPTLRRLARVAGHLDPSSVLGEEILERYWRGHELALLDMVGGQQWEPPGDGELKWGQEWADRIDELSEHESRRLWSAAHASRHELIARRLHQRYGLTNPLWYVNAWYAGVQVQDGDADAARVTLLHALTLAEGQVYHASDVLPLDLAVQDTLRIAATPTFRAKILADLPARLPWKKPTR